MKKILLISMLLLSMGLAAQVKQIGNVVFVKSESLIYLIFKPQDEYHQSSLMEIKNENIGSFVTDLKKAAEEDNKSNTKWENEDYQLSKKANVNVRLSAKYGITNAEFSSKELYQIIEWVSTK